jgi:DNA-binding CsgD family transcriptional regulator
MRARGLELTRPILGQGPQPGQARAGIRAAPFPLCSGPTGVHVDESVDLQLAVEVREALEQIAGLTAQQVRIFSLHIAGLSYHEICKATGYSWTQVNRHMLPARSRVRALRRSAASTAVPIDQMAPRRWNGPRPAIGSAAR